MHTVSGSISLRCSRSFSPFLHSTGPLSVFQFYLALRDGPRGFRQDCTCPVLLRCRTTRPYLPVRDCHPLRCGFPAASGLQVFVLLRSLGSSHFARHYSGNRSFFLFLQVIRCFSSLRALMTTVMCHAFNMAGSPIRIRADQLSFADPRTFSQLTASFFALGSPGILRMHFSRFSCGFCSC